MISIWLLFPRVALLLFLIVYAIAAAAFILNNPYPAKESTEKIYYTSFAEQPKTLDPAQSYAANEYQFIMQIYEPLLTYDYLKRPYTLIPLIAAQLPKTEYLDQNKQVLPNALNKVAYTRYRIQIKRGIVFQPHPAFAKDQQGSSYYLHLNEEDLAKLDIRRLADFPFTGTRELVVDDYIYQIKRLADPGVSSPIYGLLSEYIVGFREFGQQLPPLSQRKGFLDLRRYNLSGIRKIDNYHFEILIKGQYPQFLFWLAMPFFAPIAWESDQFYSQPGMDDKNLSFDWYPVGTGPFLLRENNPNKRMVLGKNPYFREEKFPVAGTIADQRAGYLAHQGERLPLIDRAIFILEKEAIPRWNKFLQGYYDASGISPDSFDQAIKIDSLGKLQLSEAMKAKKIYLTKTDDPTVIYLGFNMLDPIVGGFSERARKLRLAISLAINYDENIAIFMNGRGKPAQGPIPPGIFGSRNGALGINPYIYHWVKKGAKRWSLEKAKALLTAAGYLNGIDPKTKQPLLLHYDVAVSNGPDDKTQLEWMRKQFAKIGIELDVRATQYNRFQEKLRAGNAQIFSAGWNADYPDPENFLILLYGPNGKAKYGGENAANYFNPQYDALFNQMKNRSNDVTRQQLIDKMVALLRHDAPWVWGINSQTLTLSQQWLSPTKVNTISLNTLKYIAINEKLRYHLREQWNQPLLWPLALLGLCFIFLLGPFYFAYRVRERSTVPRFHL